MREYKYNNLLVELYPQDDEREDKYELYKITLRTYMIQIQNIMEEI